MLYTKSDISYTIHTREKWFLKKNEKNEKQIIKTTKTLRVIKQILKKIFILRQRVITVLQSQT